MSVPIDKANSTIKTGVQNLPAGSRQDKAFKFDPAKAEQQKSAQRDPDLFTQVMQEATDGDTSEAVGLASLGLAKRNGVREDGADPAIKQKDMQADGSGAPEAVESNEDPEEAQDAIALALRKRSSTQTVGGADKIDEAQLSAVVSIEERHDRLMTLAASMERQQVATHESAEHAAVLTETFKKANWTMQPSVNDNLVAHQMISASN